MISHCSGNNHISQKAKFNLDSANVKFYFPARLSSEISWVAAWMACFATAHCSDNDLWQTFLSHDSLFDSAIVQFGFLGIHSYWPPVKLQLFCKQFNRKSSDHGVSNCDKKSFLVEIHFWKNTCNIFYSWQTIFARPSPDPLADFGCMQKLYKRAAVNQILHNILRYLTIFDNIWQCLPQYLPKYLWPHDSHLQTASACRN